MFSRRVRIVLLLMVSAILLTLTTGILTFNFRSWQFWTLMAAAGCGASGIFWLWPRRREEDLEIAGLRTQLTQGTVKNREQSEAFEKAKAILLVDLGTRAQRLEERERDLLTRFARFHEFLEYPTEDVHAEQVTGELQKLSEQDRNVRQLLEVEAERVYEKIRRNGYTVEGRVDVLTIRDEALDLIKQVARVYKPECEFPLLETSFEQLARAASRICLHTLVLLEQLPVSVQHYNINTLYGYIRKAVVGYGVYQKSAPWLSYLSRGLYAGRMVAATNPAALGAWWLATELGKRGAQKLVENVVDRQAVAVLHNLVTIIGVEAAGIYGTGFRQRDPAWIFGTELVELIHAFPASGESLKYGLRQITALPLRSEYDRIYLYRCLANHQSAGLQLADSAMLSRDERETIARQLEEFFAKHIHGASEANVKRWREGFERRFDLRLKLETSEKRSSTSKEGQVEQAVLSLVAFLRHVIALGEPEIYAAVRNFRTLAMLIEPQRQVILQKVSRRSALPAFEPPELDPTLDITEAYLNDLAFCVILPELVDEHAEQLVLETWSYFRRTAKESEAGFGNAWKQKLRSHSVEPSVVDEVPYAAARTFLTARQGDEKLVFVYGGLSRRCAGAVVPLPNTWLFGTESGNGSPRRAFVAGPQPSGEVLWTAVCPLLLERVSGIMIDDLAVKNGRWTAAPDTTTEISAPSAISAADDLLVAGSLRGGRYKSYFKMLLECSGGT